MTTDTTDPIAGVVVNRTGPTTMRDGRRGFGMTLSGARDLVQRIAEAAVTFFEGEGGVNYVEFTVHHDTAGAFVHCIQRASGKTPHELRRDAEARAEQAEARAEQAEASAAAMREALEKHAMSWSGDSSWCVMCRTRTSQALDAGKRRIPKAHPHAPGCALATGAPLLAERDALRAERAEWDARWDADRERGNAECARLRAELASRDATLSALREAVGRLERALAGSRQTGAGARCQASAHPCLSGYDMAPSRACGYCDACCGHARGICSASAAAGLLDATLAAVHAAC